MKSSNLAECLEEFAATLDAMDAPKDKPRVVAVADADPKARAPRLSLNFRRIRISDPGLRHFRIF